MVKLTVKHLKSLKSSSVSSEVFVNSGDVMCVYVGGENLGLRLDGSLLLDMSRSYDSNLNPSQTLNSNSNSNSNLGLLFELSCFQISPSYRDGCDSLIFSPQTSSFSQVVVTVNSSFVPEVTTKDVFKIVMRGRSRNGNTNGNGNGIVEDVRRCEKVLELSILDSLAPVLRLELLSGSKINPSSKLKILGRVDMKSGGELLWSMNDDSSLSLSSDDPDSSSS